MDIDNPVTIAGLEKVFQESIAKARTDYDFYDKGKLKYRILSVVMRILPLILTVLGVILPLINRTQAGYICLLLAVFIFAIDQAFMLSGSWIRYVNAEVKIETLIRRTEYEWLKMKSGISNDAAAHEQREKALDLFQRLVVDSGKVVEDETAAWGTELNKGLQILNNLIKEQRTGVEASYNQEKKARIEAMKIGSAATTGGVTVEIDNSERLQGVLTVAVDDQAIERFVPIQKVVFPRVQEGQHAVVLKATDTNGKAIQAEDLVSVQVNQIAKVKFTLPGV